MTERTNQITEEVTNQIRLCGTMITPPIFNHELMGEKFYKFSLETIRRSGIADIIEVMVSDRILYFCDKKVGDKVAIEGQIRTHNADNGLKIYAFVKNICEPGEDDVNEVTLTGYICKEVIFRGTPLGRKISDFLLAVNRKYNKSDYIPCICWSRNAKFVSSLPVGSKLKVNGRLQSREYLKRYENGEEEIKTVNELSISALEVI